MYGGWIQTRTFDLSGGIIEEIDKHKKDHIIFDEYEMDILWDNVSSMKFVDWILTQYYMEWRHQELAVLRLEEINLDDWYMPGQNEIRCLKTKNRSDTYENKRSGPA